MPTADDDISSLPQPVVLLRRNGEMSGVFDIALKNIQTIKSQCHFFELHAVLYPYSRQIKSDNYHFLPFEEYIEELSEHKRSAYFTISDYANRWFGLYFGGIIAFIFALFRPSALLDIEAVVSIFGAYLLGKDLWTDIERSLIKATQNRKICFQDRYYSYQLERNTTLSNYSMFAKKQRYGIVHLLPDKLEFIENSNSQTARLWFDMKSWGDLEDDIAHVFSIHFDKNSVQYLDEEGFLFGIKLSFNQRKWYGLQQTEIFQSLHQKQLGCLDQKARWVEQSAFYRKTLSVTRFKYFKSNNVLKEKAYIEAPALEQCPC